jgi:hypothetical protein
MHESVPSKLQPAIATSTSVTASGEPERLHPVLWPLAAYLAVGTLLLFVVSQLDSVAAYVMPWDEKGNRWHEGSAGWMALYPLTLPVLLVYATVRLGYALPLRGLELVWRGIRRIGEYLATAWAAVRALIRRTREALQAMLHDAMRAVRRAAERTVRSVREALARVTSR